MSDKVQTQISTPVTLRIL